MALTLQQIIDRADKYPNSETNSYKVGILDSLQRQLFREFYFPEQVEQMETVAGTSLYALPSYIVPQRIKSVVLTDSDGSNAQEYRFRSPSSQLTGYGYTYLNADTSSTILLYPEPTETGRYIWITFEDGPNDLSSTNMSTVPRLFKDYHDGIFVNYLKMRLAQDRSDVAQANNFFVEYDYWLGKAKDSINVSDGDGSICVQGVW